jgi:hypothetical protein
VVASTAMSAKKKPRRLIITGLPCPPEVWEDFFGPHPSQKVLSLADVLENSTSSDLRVISRYVTEEIEKFRPDSIVSHGFGVPMTLMSLLRLNRRGTLLDTKVTLFNGAFRKIDIFKSHQPLRAQYLTYKQAVREVQDQKGAVDQRLRPHLARIRAIYRRVILVSIMEKISLAIGVEELLNRGKLLPVKNPIQIITSPTDPYLSADDIEQLKRDFPAKRIVEVDYGHFPYSVNRSKILPLVEEFENIKI